MPPDQAMGVATAVVPHGGTPCRNAADPARGVLPSRSVRVRRIDAELPRTVHERLTRLLARRVAQATAVDATFGADVAERVARFTLGGGRRIRPQFLWWGLRACGLPDDEQIEAALQLGAALELIQTCALVHDDVMDQAPVRRGRPALHVDFTAQYRPSAPADGARFGESAAILAGDLALAWADDEAAALDLTGPQARRLRETWSQMRLEMVAGQYLDVQGEHTRNRSLRQAIRAACLKTALYTVERPLQLGAILGRADETTLRALCSAGRGAGLAFQLRDDLDDAFGDPVRRDKPAAGDLRAGKPTYLVALAHARAERDDDHRSLAILARSGSQDLDDDDLDDLRYVLERTGARQLVEDKIRHLAAQSARHLDSAPLDPVAHTRLRLLLRQVAGTPTSPNRSAGVVEGAAR
ncbi:polyprenyl synthetase family protein [Streptomyces sp. NPDC057694]|uniref:polyprenyl synthetase family protein n=1 Tax=Streptomyces sp. NPDC057694 TaxID=3346216 RepID=UPI0036C2AC07